MISAKRRPVPFVRPARSQHDARVLALAHHQILQLADKLRLPYAQKKTQVGLREQAEFIFARAFVRTHLVRQYSIREVAGASLYAACRIAAIGRSLREFKAASEVSRLGRIYRSLVYQLNLQRPLPDYGRPIERIASKAKVSWQAKQLAYEILSEAKKDGLTSGKDPTSFAGATLYYAALLNGERVSRLGLANAAGISDDAIRSNYVFLITRGVSGNGYVLPIDLTLSPKESVTVYIPIAAKSYVRLKVIVDWQTKRPSAAGTMEI